MNDLAAMQRAEIPLSPAAHLFIWAENLRAARNGSSSGIRPNMIPIEEVFSRLKETKRRPQLWRSTPR
jgi:hypothetical protein